MKVYCYCSYTGSPVGYILGELSYDAAQSGSYTLNHTNAPSFIKRCFEQDIVRKGFGKLPGSDSEYFLLFKKLMAKGRGGAEASEYYINLALVTHNMEEYNQWVGTNNETTPQDIAQAVQEMMEIDRMNDFGFTVRPEALDKLLRLSFRSLFDIDAVSKHPQEAYFNLITSKPNCDELKAALGLSEPDKDLCSVVDSEKWVRYGKKKLNSTPTLFAVLALAAVGILAAVILLKRR